MATIFEQLNEATDYTVTVTSDKDTSGSSVEAFVYDEATGSETSLGSASGALADQDITLSLNTSELDPGNYYLEI